MIANMDEEELFDEAGYDSFEEDIEDLHFDEDGDHENTGNQASDRIRNEMNEE